MPERSVRAQAVVEAPPIGDEDLRFPEREEDLAVEEFVPQLAGYDERTASECKKCDAS